MSTCNGTVLKPENNVSVRLCDGLERWQNVTFPLPFFRSAIAPILPWGWLPSGSVNLRLCLRSQPSNLCDNGGQPCAMGLGLCCDGVCALRQWQRLTGSVGLGLCSVGLAPALPTKHRAKHRAAPMGLCSVIYCDGVNCALWGAVGLCCDGAGEPCALCAPALPTMQIAPHPITEGSEAILDYGVMTAPAGAGVI